MCVHMTWHFAQRLNNVLHGFTQRFTWTCTPFTMDLHNIFNGFAQHFTWIYTRIYMDLQTYYKDLHKNIHELIQRFICIFHGWQMEGIAPGGGGRTCASPRTVRVRARACVSLCVRACVSSGMCACVRACTRVRAFVHARFRACVRARVCASDSDGHAMAL